MKVLFFILLCLFAVTGFSQSLSYNQFEFLKVANTSNGVTKNNFESQYSDVTGSPYFNDNWQNGQAVMLTGKIYTELQLKINLYLNKIFLNQKDTIYDITDVPQLKEIVVFPDNDTTHKMVFSNSFIIGGKPQLVQVLEEGKISFLKRDSRDLDEVQTGLNTAKEKVFTQKTTYLIVKDNNNSSEAKLSKKNLEKNFSPQEWQTITTYANDKKLSLSNEADVAAALHYLNGL